jgi:hypothetical protein
MTRSKDRAQRFTSPRAEWVTRKPILCSSHTVEPPTIDPEFHSLQKLLAKCPIHPDELPKVLTGLVRPPLSLGQNLAPDPESLRGVVFEVGIGNDGRKAFVKRSRLFDREDAEILKCLAPVDTKTERAPYMQTKRLWGWLGEAHGLSVSQKGRTPEVDPALVFYCDRLLLDASRSTRIKIGRPNGGGAVTSSDPLWLALIEALPFAQRFLEFRFGRPARRPQKSEPKKRTRTDHNEAIAEILLTSRSNHFENVCRKRGLPAAPSPSDVAGNPFGYREAFYSARLSARKGGAQSSTQAAVTDRSASRIFLMWEWTLAWFTPRGRLTTRGGYQCRLMQFEPRLKSSTTGPTTL